MTKSHHTPAAKYLLFFIFMYICLLYGLSFLSTIFLRSFSSCTVFLRFVTSLERGKKFIAFLKHSPEEKRIENSASAPLRPGAFERRLKR